MARIKNQIEYQQSKDHLANSFFGILCSKDFKDITIKEICEKAGVAVGTFYYYYKNKEQIIAEKFLNTDSRFLNDLSPYLTHMDFFKDIFLYVSFFDYMGRTNGLNYMKQVFKSVLLNGSSKPLLKKNGVITLASIIASGQECGIVKSDLNPNSVACEIYICLRGFTFHWCTGTDNYSYPNEKLTFMRRYLYGIINPEYYESLDKYEL
ncbi:MAG: TetR/AcrR family transcriptional regulator [Eubacteriales bacterium]|nr:TetR/AcrR family transcriptional regulator [Eubacteriales bacterium]